MKPTVTLVMAMTLSLAAAASANAQDRIADGQWFHQLLKTEQANQITRGDGVTVAVIDTGVDANHPDLAGSVLPGMDFTGTQGNGHTDSDGHGTLMASLIVAHGRVKGVAPQAKVLPVRAGVVEGSRSANSAAGIRWAVAQGAKVLSLSYGSEEEDLLERQEVLAAIAADVVVVAGVGNRPKSTSVQFPAAIPGVLAVAGVDKNGEHAEVSVSGQQVVIAAPSTGISGATPGAKFAEGSGTSAATAITAGAVALVRAKFPQLKAPEVIRRLTATAIDKGSPGRDSDYGYGVLNIVGALTADLPTAASASPARASSAVGAQPPPARGHLAWWLLILAVIPLAAIGIIAVLRARRRIRVGR